MINYNVKTYGRNKEIRDLYKMFAADRDVTMPGPRRLGKTFMLGRLVDESAANGWTAVKAELAGCSDSGSVFRELCGKIGGARAGGAQAIAFITQRLMQFVAPRTEFTGPWYQPFIGVDHESYFERLIQTLHEDKGRRWVLLIDELPIFLKALHDKGPAGVASARDFMNNLNRLRTNYPRVRWMITGSIGIEPLAKVGSYMGALAKFAPFKLEPLSSDQAKDYIQDRARAGGFLHRQEITDAEAQALIDATGWLAPFYLDALTARLDGPLQSNPVQAKLAVDAAISDLMNECGPITFGTWEEHLSKHYKPADRALALKALGALAHHPNGMDLGGVLASVDRVDLSTDELRQVLMQLCSDGFIIVDSWGNPEPRCRFLNPLLRLWWLQARPHFSS